MESGVITPWNTVLAMEYCTSTPKTKLVSHGAKLRNAKLRNAKLRNTRHSKLKS